MSQLSTHVLDTASGKPASSLSMQLVRLEKDESRLILKQDTTNQNGRTDTPLLAKQDMQAGTYELIFHVGPYLQRTHNIEESQLFLDIVTIRFRITNSNEKYHVPLLLSPWSYSTYRGS